MASMKGAEVARIDENDKPVSTDEALKESSAPRSRGRDQRCHVVAGRCEAPAGRAPRDRRPTSFAANREPAAAARVVERAVALASGFVVAHGARSRVRDARTRAADVRNRAERGGAPRGYCGALGAFTSFTMKTRSPGLISPSSRLAISSIADGILAQASRLFAQPRVLGPLTRDRRRQLIVLVPRPQHRQQAAVADQAVDDNDGGDEQHQQLDDPPLARGGRLRHPCPASRCRFGFSFLRHAAKTVQQLLVKVQERWMN